MLFQILPTIFFSEANVWKVQVNRISATSVAFNPKISIKTGYNSLSLCLFCFTELLSQWPIEWRKTLKR